MNFAFAICKLMKNCLTDDFLENILEVMTNPYEGCAFVLVHSPLYTRKQLEAANLRCIFEMKLCIIRIVGERFGSQDHYQQWKLISYYKITAK